MINNTYILLLLVGLSVAILSILIYNTVVQKSSFKLFNENYSKSISLFQWNTHYECFTTETNGTCCSKPLESYINNNLINRNVDFANFSMFELKTYIPPENYTIINPFSHPDKTCGYDITCLVYNNKRWKQVSDNNVYPYYGCLQYPSDPHPKSKKGSWDRSFIIQKFTDSKGVIMFVIGAHYSHDPELSTKRIAQTLQKLNITDKDNIIFMADTNDINPQQPTTNSSFMSQLLHTTPSNVQGTTTNMATCCCSDTPKAFQYKTDRIISNFGAGLTPQLGNLNQIFPDIQNPCSPLVSTSDPVVKCKLGEMHLPLFWVLNP